MVEHLLCISILFTQRTIGKNNNALFELGHIICNITKCVFDRDADILIVPKYNKTKITITAVITCYAISYIVQSMEWRACDSINIIFIRNEICSGLISRQYVKGSVVNLKKLQKQNRKPNNLMHIVTYTTIFIRIYTYDLKIIVIHINKLAFYV